MAHYRAELTGVFGDPVDDNPTIVLEEAGYQALGLNYRYLTIKVLPDDLQCAIDAVRAMHFRGINLTMPHKIKVIPMLDELSEAAQIIGAVNTVINEDGHLIGENTDGKGFTRSLMREGVELAGKKIMILGAGGAARAIAVECALAGAAQVLIASRREAPGQELSELIRTKTKAASEYILWKPADTSQASAPGQVSQGVLQIPADTDILGVTILGEEGHSADCDALSTSCLILGIEKAKELIGSLDGYEALFIDRDGNLSRTDGMIFEEN
jgi:shikimate 5-dehydrogenase